ncbi:unnamed protein product [Lampetra fluviatilis]
MGDEGSRSGLHGEVVELALRGSAMDLNEFSKEPQRRSELGPRLGHKQKGVWQPQDRSNRAKVCDDVEL